MAEDKTAAMIRPLEDLAAAEPGKYRFRVGLLLALGYFYLLFIVVVLLLIVAAVLLYARLNWVVLKILWIPLVLVGLVLRSLWITIPVPDGEELETPFYVLGVVAACTWRDGSNDKHIDPLFEELSKMTSLPSPLIFLSLDGEHGYLRPKLSAVPGATLFTTVTSKSVPESKL